MVQPVQLRPVHLIHPWILYLHQDPVVLQLLDFLWDPGDQFLLMLQLILVDQWDPVVRPDRLDLEVRIALLILLVLVDPAVRVVLLVLVDQVRQGVHQVRQVHRILYLRHQGFRPPLEILWVLVVPPPLTLQYLL